MAPCRAVFFDFDGVIVESEEIKSRAFVALYREHGSSVVDAIVAHPILLNRPVVTTPKGARVCRPAELALDLL